MDNSDKLKSLFSSKPKSIDEGGDIAIEERLSSHGGYIVDGKGLLKADHWIEKNQEKVSALINEYGAVLLRNFYLPDSDSFRIAFSKYCESLIDYKDRTSPRSEINSKVYTSTDYPKDRVIHLHNELSYSGNTVTKIAFYCLVAPEKMGETPLADSRKVFSNLSKETQDKFLKHGVMYIRRITPEIGLSWQEVYQTDQKKEVENHCQNEGINYKWENNDTLLLNWKRPAIIKHPTTGEFCWFNHVFFYNQITLSRLVNVTIEESDLPFHTKFGDGSEISEREIDEIDRAYQQVKITFPWQTHDLLLMDNILMAHGRNPYEGERKILVAMGDAIKRN